MQKLKKYIEKRNFATTPEPSIKTKNKLKIKNPIFVIQHHFATREHFDFRLEHNGVLLSWAVPKGLSNNPADKRLAVHVEDHPLEYANFEGVIPAGNYGAGTVEIFDYGNYIPSYNMDYGLKKGHIKVILNGKKFKGEYSLIKMDEKNWLIKKSENSLKNENILIENKNNLNKNKNILLKNKKIIKKTEKIKNNSLKNSKFTKINKNLNKNPFNKCEVQLCTLTKQIPTGDNWAFEIKYDGYRILAYKENENIKLVTRNGQDYTKKFPQIAKSLLSIKHNFVLDGEVVSFDDFGRSNFGMLQQNIKTAPEKTQYVVFDLLAINRRDLRALPLIERKQMLQNLILGSPSNLIYSQHVLGEGKKCFEFAKTNNLEGIVAKQINSLYRGVRDDSWLKIKCYMRQEFVVCGYIKTAQNPVLSALVLGYYQNKTLKFVGKVGTGFNEADRLNLSSKLNKIKSACPFKTSPIKKAEVVWCKPKLVAEIQFAELTKENVLRQPSFIALRTDKPANSVTLEKAK